MASTRLKLDSRAIKKLGSGRDAARLTQKAGDAVASLARDLAPKRTGAGAASIQARVATDSDGAYAEVSWDAAHSYMRFHGPFLVPALKQARLR